MNIILYKENYKDNMISMIKEARVALGLSDTVRDDLYDVIKNYLDKGDSFFLAIDEFDHVIGCLGFSRIPNTNEAFLHRFYIKADRKRQGIGSQLLQFTESTMKEAGIAVSKVHLGNSKENWFESYSFYPKHGYIEYEPRYMKKVL